MNRPAGRWPGPAPRRSDPSPRSRPALVRSGGTRRRGCPGGTRRTPRATRSPRSWRWPSSTSRPGRSPRGWCGTAANYIPPPSAVDSTASAYRRRSPRARPGTPRHRWACSMSRSTTPDVGDRHRPRRRRQRTAVGTASVSSRSPKASRTQRDDLTVVHPAGDGHHHLVRRVPPPVVAGHLGAGHGLDGPACCRSPGRRPGARRRRPPRTRRPASPPDRRHAWRSLPGSPTARCRHRVAATLASSTTSQTTSTASAACSASTWA